MNVDGKFLDENVASTAITSVSQTLNVTSASPCLPPNSLESSKISPFPTTSRFPKTEVDWNVLLREMDAVKRNYNDYATGEAVG